MAKRFKFRLEPVLKYRERIEEGVRERFVHIQQIRHAKQSEIESVRAEAQKAKGAMGDSKLGSLDVPKLKSLNRYITGLGVSEQQKTGELRVIDTEVEKRRLEFVKARQDVRVMEKLKDRRRSEHEYVENSEQTKLFDEMAVRKVAALKLRGLMDARAAMEALEALEVKGATA